MRKVIKNVVKTAVAALCVLLLLVVTLPLVLSLVASVPAVQNAAARRVMAMFSEKLGTKVSIDRIDIKLINRVVVEGFYVEDFHGDTLLYVPRLTAPVVEWGLGGRKGAPLTFGRVGLEKARLWIRRDSASMINIREVVIAMRGDKPPNPDSKFRMNIMGIEADSLTFGLLRYDRPFTDKGRMVDWDRFVIRNTCVSIDDFAISRDTIRMDIRSLSFDERSSWRVDRLEAHDLVVSRAAVSLYNARIRCEGRGEEADLDAPYIQIRGLRKDWLAFSNFNDSVALDIDVRRSQFTARFLGRFVPVVGDWDLALEDVSAHTKGPLTSLSGGIESLHAPGTSLALDFRSRGIPDLKNMRVEASIRNLAITGGGAIDSLVRGITGKGLPESILAPVERLGAIALTGNVSGRLDNFDTSARLFSDAGNTDVSANISTSRNAGTKGVAVDGRIVIPELDLGRVLAVGDMGSVSGNLSVHGAVRGGKIDGEALGDITGLEFRGHTYRETAFDAALDGDVFELGAVVRDPALHLDLSGSLDRSRPTPEYALELDIRKADLAAMNLNAKDSVSVVSGSISASLNGTRLDDINGVVIAHNLAYVSPYGTVDTPVVTLTARNDETEKHLSLSSEFADVEFHSRTGYRTMFANLDDFMRGYIPMLDSRRVVGEEGGIHLPPLPDQAADNNSTLILKMKNSDRLLKAFSPETGVAKGSEVSFVFNPYIRSFSLTARSEFLEYRGMLITGIELDSDNRSDSLMLRLSAADIYSGAMHIPDFALHGAARGGRMNVSTRPADISGSFSAILGLSIDSGREGLVFRFSPSQISLDHKTWRLEAGAITYAGGNRLAVDDLNIFSADNPSERLTVGGVVSRGASDTLRVEFNDFDLSPSGRLFKRGEDKKLAVGGRATGYIDVISLLNDPKMNAGIDLRALSLNGIEAAPLRFTSFWDRSIRRNRFQMLNERNGINVLYGSLSTSKGEIDAVADIGSFDAALLDPLLGDLLEDTRGKADARLTLGGTFKELRLDGRVNIPRFETTVKYTRARYILEGGEMRVENSVLRLPRTTVRDTYGNTADFSMTVDMSNPRNVNVGIEANTRGLLVFDTGPDDNDAFYGRIFATGSMGIRSGRMGTRMNISARTDRGTQFHLPLDGKSNISWADFVVFSDRSQRLDTTDVLARKKLAYERRLRGPARAATRKSLDINITAGLTPDAEVHMQIDPDLGEGITAHGEGVIDLKINPATDLFTMTGDYSISEGRFDFSMRDVFNKSFTISPGSTLRWSGAPEDVLLGVKASWRVRTSLLPLVGEGSSFVSGRSTVPVDCILQLAGRLSEPEITFDIDLPSADPDARLIAASTMNTQELKSMQFLSLLTTGSFAADNSITGQSANSGVMATGAVGFDILTNQINNFLSSDDYDIYFRYRPQSDYSGNQYDLGLSTGFIDNRLLLEIEGNYVDDRAAMSVGTSNVSNLAGDVSLTWVIDRAGNLRLKVFSQTIDRPNETQGLQESGLGIYWKKDFEHFGDIFRKSGSRTDDNFSTFARDSVTVKKPKRKKKQ